MSDDIRPPIPARYPQKNIRAGLAMPFVNVRLADGGVDLRSQHYARVKECWETSRCQLCAQQIAYDDGAALVGSPVAIRELVFSEPPMHRECMVYATRACPVLSGRWANYPKGPSLAEKSRGQACYEPNCDCGGWVPSPGDEGPRHAGRANHPWWVVFASEWDLVYTGDGRIHGGMLAIDQVTSARLISTPERGRVWQRVDDLAALREKLRAEAAA